MKPGSKVLFQLGIIILILPLALMNPVPARAQEFDCQSGFGQIYDGVEYKKQELNDPRQLAVFTVKIDLDNPNIGVFITPKDGLGTTTSKFLENYGLQLAINGDESINLFPKGMAAAQGNIYAPKTNEPVIFFSQEKEVTMGHDIPSPVWDAIAGSHTIVENGKVGTKISSCAKPEYCEHLQPRTAVGVTANNRLTIFVIDGRQSGYSEGVTLIELANLMVKCGAESAINLDGGGSTTLATENGGVINQPSDGTERVIANHLGIFAKPGAGYVPPPPPESVPLPTSDYPPPGTLCNQYQFTNEPHPLRPAPALVCQDKVPEPYNLSCANDIIPKFTVNRPRTTVNPGDSVEANTSCSKSGCRWDCRRDETLTEGIIGPVNITIDLTGLELPIAGIASRNCDTGNCDVDQIAPATGEKQLSDSFLMRNYTSWYLQGAIEQADQIPPDIQPKFLDRALSYAGSLKKLIPPEVLNGLPNQDLAGQREELIREAAAGRTYNQIVGYVNGNQVISRIEAKQKGLTGPGHAIRLADMKDHVNPPDNPDDPEAMKWYTLWHQVPFASSGHVDTAGEFFPTACLRSSEDNRRCQTDPQVLDAKLKITSGLDSFRVYFPHLVEDDTLLAKLLQNALVSQEIPRSGAIPTYTELSQNLADPDRQPEWTISDDGTYRNASGCRIDNALSNPGDSLEAKRNKKQGLITAQLQFKRRVSYDYRVSDTTCDPNPITGDVPVPVSAPVPVHIRYSHMDEIAGRTVAGPGSIFKALYPEIPLTVGDEIPNRPAQSGLSYSCTASGGCTAASTSNKGGPNAFFPWWGTTLEFFHQKIQCMLDPLQQGCAGLFTPEPPGGDNTTGGVCQDSDMKATHQPNSKESAIIAASAQECVDASILRAVLDIEAGPGYQPVPGSDACTVNACGAAGPMQILSGWDNVNCDPAQCNGNTCDADNNGDGILDGWCAKYAAADDAGKQHIRDLFAPPAGNLNVCNLDDALIVAAQKLKAKSLGKVSQLGCLHAIEADREGLVRAVMSYYGNRYNPSLTPSQNCANPDDKIARLGNLTYCEYVLQQIGLTP